MYTNIFKRSFHFFVALIALICLSPIIIFVALLLIFSNKGNPFFLQRRPGKNEIVFTLIKFRSMNNKRDKEGNLLPDHKRLTKVGTFVRKTSLDEVPQLLNVLAGDMSIIGPRPLLVQYLALYNVFQKRRHEVRPGMTGWAQINGRNAISWDEKFDLNIFHVNNISFKLDLKILFLTVAKVFKSEGVSPSDTVTMEVFKGNN